MEWDEMKQSKCTSLTPRSVKYVHVYAHWAILCNVFLTAIKKFFKQWRKERKRNVSLTFNNY